jgi:pimeloyl-ACP methyl ester carboxylesterase
MSFFSEFRNPTRWYAKLLAAILALVFFALLANGTIAGFLLYRILSPVRSPAESLSSDFPGRPETITFNVPGQGPRQAWFCPGLKSAPTIILCHGYQSSRSELLTLESALQEHQYNVFLFDFTAHGSTPGLSTMGFGEVDELTAAIAEVGKRQDVDSTRFGIWGTDLGAYAAAEVAARDSRVKALVLDSLYDRPRDLVRLQVKRSGLGAIPLMENTVLFAFYILNHKYRVEPPLAARLPKLAGISKLFIEAADDPELERSTNALFQESPGPKELTELARGNYAGMLDEEKRSYENRIVSFFLLNCSPYAVGRRP